MGKNATSLLIGLAAGAVIGVLGYRFSKSEKADELRDDATRAWLKTRIKARKAYRKAKMQAATALADGAHTLADKADALQDKANSYHKHGFHTAKP